jgi:hypothetical protein
LQVITLPLVVQTAPVDDEPALKVAGPGAAVHSAGRDTRELWNDATASMAGLAGNRNGAPARRRL